jgi:hypothetical protein
VASAYAAIQDLLPNAVGSHQGPALVERAATAPGRVEATTEAVNQSLVPNQEVAGAARPAVEIRIVAEAEAAEAAAESDAHQKRIATTT